MDVTIALVAVTIAHKSGEQPLTAEELKADVEYQLSGKGLLVEVGEVRLKHIGAVNNMVLGPKIEPNPEMMVGIEAAMQQTLAEEIARARRQKPAPTQPAPDSPFSAGPMKQAGSASTPEAEAAAKEKKAPKILFFNPKNAEDFAFDPREFAKALSSQGPAEAEPVEGEVEPEHPQCWGCGEHHPEGMTKEQFESENFTEEEREVIRQLRKKPVFDDPGDPIHKQTKH